MRIRLFSRESRYVIKKMLKVSFIATLFIFLVLNIAYSQLIPSQYFGVVNDDRDATIHFLKAIKSLPQFTEFFTVNRNLYGATIEDEIFKKDKEREQLIAQLEVVLKDNPKARDILYNLYLLYNESGNHGKAQYFYDKAKEIDPSVKYTN